MAKKTRSVLAIQGIMALRRTPIRGSDSLHAYKQGIQSRRRDGGSELRRQPWASTTRSCPRIWPIRAASLHRASTGENRERNTPNVGEYFASSRCKSIRFQYPVARRVVSGLGGGGGLGDVRTAIGEVISAPTMRYWRTRTTDRRNWCGWRRVDSRRVATWCGVRLGIPAHIAPASRSLMRSPPSISSPIARRRPAKGHRARGIDSETGTSPIS